MTKKILTTQPIRDKGKIKEMKKVLTRDRDRIMFLLGINSGLRISDIVNRKCDEFKGDTVEVREKKTGKIKVFKLSPAVADEIHGFIKKRHRIWLFESRQGGHMSTRQARRILTSAAKVVGLEHFSTHSMRKTFGYQAWKMGVPFSLIMSALNHSSPQVTQRYLGITQDIVNDGLYSKMAL